MNKTWMIVVVAAVIETGWVIGMKHADNALEWSLTCAAIAASFILLIKASRTLPVGTTYAVFVGLGTAGTVIAEMALFKAEVRLEKLLLIALLLAGVVGLKLLSGDSGKKEAATK